MITYFKQDWLNGNKMKKEDTSALLCNKELKIKTYQDYSLLSVCMMRGQPYTEC